MTGSWDDAAEVWYVAYGSNLLASRFACYLSGGRPDGARRTYPGCRDSRPARRDQGVFVPGSVGFAGSSITWGGGMAFLDPDAAGQTAPARAYLVTFEQFRDIVAQETRQATGTPLVLDEAGSRWSVGFAAYETVIHLGDLGGAPMLSVTSLDPGSPQPPTAEYLRTILSGLSEAHGWTAEQGVDYLLARPGVSPAWTGEAMHALFPAR